MKYNVNFNTSASEKAIKIKKFNYIYKITVATDSAKFAQKSSFNTVIYIFEKVSKNILYYLTTFILMDIPKKILGDNTPVPKGKKQIFW